MYVDFVTKNYDLIVILIVIAVLISLVKKKAGYITSGILGLIFIFRICGIVPDFTSIVKTIGPAIAELATNIVKMLYDFFMMLAKGLE